MLRNPSLQVEAFLILIVLHLTLFVPAYTPSPEFTATPCSFVSGL